MNKDNYGYNFNEITISDGTLTKLSKNKLGTMKINNEINFYLYITENCIKFPMPNLIAHSEGCLSIQYLSNTDVLTNIINQNNTCKYIEQILLYMKNIHIITIYIENDIILNDVNIEVNKKVLSRFNEYEWSSDKTYNSIKSVNNIVIHNIQYYCEHIHQRLKTLLRSRTEYSLIHGDIHLGNILVDNKLLYFIDPRGYFGNTKLFGLCEYDFAKLMFGLSGYSVFDNMTINKLNIINGNVDIDFIKQYEYVFQLETFDEITRLFCLSIWLANNSCFTDISKKITSLMIASYYCEKYIQCVF